MAEDQSDFDNVQFIGPGPDGAPHMFSVNGFIETWKKEFDKKKQEGSVQAHEYDRFVNDLDDFQLRQIEALIEAVMQDLHFGLRTLGRIEQLRATKFNICAMCGVNHDEELAHMVAMPESNQPVPDSIAPILREPVQAPLEMTNLQKMKKWNLEPDPEGGIRCANCKMHYQSLQDRMLRAPEDCDGCKKKAAWG